jgi:hypothetical protein
MSKVAYIDSCPYCERKIYIQMPEDVLLELLGRDVEISLVGGEWKSG